MLIEIQSLTKKYGCCCSDLLLENENSFSPKEKKIELRKEIENTTYFKWADWIADQRINKLGDVKYWTKSIIEHTVPKVNWRITNIATNMFNLISFESLNSRWLLLATESLSDELIKNNWAFCSVVFPIFCFGVTFWQRKLITDDIRAINKMKNAGSQLS